MKGSLMSATGMTPDLKLWTLDLQDRQS